MHSLCGFVLYDKWSLALKKNLVALLIVFLVLSIVTVIFVSMVKNDKMVVIKTGNTKQVPLPIVLGKYQDSDCGMTIDVLDFASQIVQKNGDTRFFHDIGGMANFLKDKSFKDSVKVWVYAKDSKTWVDGRKAWYSINEQTPMWFGFGAYKDKKEGFIDYEQMNLRVLRGETLQNPKLRKKVLGL